VGEQEEEIEKTDIHSLARPLQRQKNSRRRWRIETLRIYENMGARPLQNREGELEYFQREKKKSNERKGKTKGNEFIQKARKDCVAQDMNPSVAESLRAEAKGER